MSFKLTPKELSILVNSWPEHTLGHSMDSDAICKLDEIGAKIGYGALAQLAQWIREIQCDRNCANVVALKTSRFKYLGWPLHPDFPNVVRKLHDNQDTP